MEPWRWLAVNNWPREVGSVLPAKDWILAKLDNNFILWDEQIPTIIYAYT